MIYDNESCSTYKKKGHLEKAYKTIFKPKSETDVEVKTEKKTNVHNVNDIYE